MSIKKAAEMEQISEIQSEEQLGQEDKNMTEEKNVVELVERDSELSNTLNAQTDKNLNCSSLALIFKTINEQMCVASGVVNMEI